MGVYSPTGFELLPTGPLCAHGQVTLKPASGQQSQSWLGGFALCDSNNHVFWAQGILRGPTTTPWKFRRCLWMRRPC